MNQGAGEHEPAVRAAAGTARTELRVGDLEPRWVALPESPDSLAAALQEAASREWAVVPFGAGRQQSLGGPPARYDLAVLTRRLDRITAYEPADMTVTVEAGVTYETVARTLRQHGQWLPVLPWGDGSQTLGGLVAAGVPGPFSGRYGLVRDLVLGAEIVGPDGAVTRPGGRVVKNVAGYELCKLHTGALGTLGVIASLTLRVFPRPAVREAWTLGLADPAEAAPLLAAARRLALTPVFCEWLAGQGLAEAPLKGPELPGGWFVCGLGGTAADVEAAMAMLDVAAAGLGARGERWSPWTRVLQPVLAAHEPREPLALRLGLKPARLGPVVAGLLAAGEVPAPVKAAVLVELGVARLGYAPETPAERQAILQAVRGLLAEGEYLVVEAGARAGERWWYPARDGDERLMAGLKDALDPADRLNPGRFLPARQALATA